MNQSALKVLAQKAKKRLSTAGQSIKEQQGEKATSAYLSSTTYAIVANKQRIEEDPLYDKVKALLQKTDIINPLAELTDYSIFNNLSSVEKERYIINIANKYNELRDYFLSQEKKAL